MALRYDSRSGRLVQESEEEKILRLEKMKQQQAQWDAMRMVGAKAQKQMAGVAEAKAAAAQRGISLTDTEAQQAFKTGVIPNKRGNQTGGTAGVGDRFGAGMEAARRAEEEGRRLAEEERQRIAGVYDPQISAADAERQRQLQMLQDIIGQSRGQVDAATQEFLANIPQSSAYQDVPFASLQAEQNPLLAALQSQGAGTGEVEAQRNLSNALAQQMQDMYARSAQQYQRSEQGYLDALRRAGVGAGAAGQQYLAQQQPALTSGIESQYQDLLSGLRGQKAEQESAVANRLSDLLQGIIESRADTRAKYGPAPKKKTTTKPSEPAGRNEVPMSGGGSGRQVR